MDQPSLFHEDLFDALRTCVQALGGFKVCGAKLRPEMDPHKAGEWLANCLNRQHAQKPELDHVMWVLREAKEAGCHAGMYFIARECGYTEPAPTTPDDERSELQRQFVTAVSIASTFAKRLERLSMPRAVA